MSTSDRRRTDQGSERLQLWLWPPALPEECREGPALPLALPDQRRYGRPWMSCSAEHHPGCFLLQTATAASAEFVRAAHGVSGTAQEARRFDQQR